MTFNESVVLSAIFYAVVCWSSIIIARDTNRLNKIIKKAILTLEVKLDTVAKRRMLGKVSAIIKEPFSPTP